MKSFFSIILFLISLSSFASETIVISSGRIYGTNREWKYGYKDGAFKYWSVITVGSGSGSLSYTSMGALGASPNDEVKITPGGYTQFTFRNLNNLIFYNDNGLVSLSGDIILGKDSALEFWGNHAAGITYGFKFGSGASIIPYEDFVDGSNGRNTTMRFYYFEKTGSSAMFDFSVNNFPSPGTRGMVYTPGLISTMFQRKFTIANVYLHGAAELFTTAADVNLYTFKNVVDSVNIFNIKYDTALSPGNSGHLINAYGLYHFKIHDIDIVDKYTKVDIGDNSWFAIGGSGDLFNVRLYGGWGWLTRIFASSLDSKGDVWVYNCLRLSGGGYGDVEVRSDTASWGTGHYPGITGANIHIFNCTGVNLIQAGAYTCAVVLLPDIEVGYTAEIGNLLGANLATSVTYNTGANYTLFNPGTNGSRLTVTNSNYYTTPALAGIADTTLGTILSTSPARGNGTPIAHFNFGFLNNPRGASWDLGAFQFTTSTQCGPTCNPVNGKKIKFLNL